MAEIISLFESSDFNFPYGECAYCGGDKWRILLSSGDKPGVVGFQCCNEECLIVGMFDKNKDMVIYDFKPTENKKE